MTNETATCTLQVKEIKRKANREGLKLWENKFVHG